MVRLLLLPSTIGDCGNTSKLTGHRQVPSAMGYGLPAPTLRLQTVRVGRLCLSLGWDKMPTEAIFGRACFVHSLRMWSFRARVGGSGLCCVCQAGRLERRPLGLSSLFSSFFSPAPHGASLLTTYWGSCSLSRNFSENTSSPHTPKGVLLCDYQLGDKRRTWWLHTCNPSSQKAEPGGGHGLGVV